MIEKPEYIQEIENALANPTSANPDLLRITNTAYADACVVINERLNEIKPYLDKTLRPEAIQLAEETPPDLLNWFKIHFAVHKPWSAMIQEQWNWDPPQTLLKDVATEINHAYGREDELRYWLRKHRRLPLIGGTLEERIQVLQSLVEYDPDVDVWAEQLEVLEEGFHSG